MRGRIMRGQSNLRAHAVWLLAVATCLACSPSPATIDIVPKRVKIYGIERAQRLSARILDKKGRPIEGLALNWSSSNPSVVAAEPGGRVVAKSEGKATVTASFEKVSGEIPVEVVDAFLVEISPVASLIIGPAGTSVALQATVRNSKEKPVPIPPNWESMNKAVVTVTPEGIVTSVGSGTTTVVANLGDLQGVAEVHVEVREIARLGLRPITALVRVGDSQDFAVVAFAPDGTFVEGVAAAFQSSDPKVATVDAAGKASGIARGTATIHARVGQKSAEATLLVN